MVSFVDAVVGGVVSTGEALDAPAVRSFTKYKSINDSTRFSPEGDITALVGKNESGKTAALEALYRVNPLSSGHPTAFEELRDYPRRHRSRDKSRIAQARPVTATFELEQGDIDALAKEFGPKAFTGKTLTVYRQ